MDVWDEEGGFGVSKEGGGCVSVSLILVLPSYVHPHPPKFTFTVQTPLRR